MMRWSCPECRFSWRGTMDTFDRVSMHEKSHKVVGSRRRRPTPAQAAQSRKNQGIRIRVKRAARRSGKTPASKEGKVAKSRSKRGLIISQKRTATVKKSRY